MYSSDELFQRSQEGHFGIYFPSCEATRGINTKITLEWAQKQFVTRVHTLCYFLHDVTNPWITIKTTIFTHRPRVWLARFSFCWWRHNRLLMTSQWPDNCVAITWIVISNSLDMSLVTAIFTAGRVGTRFLTRPAMNMTGNRLWRHQQNVSKPSEWVTGLMWRRSSFSSSFMDS